MLWLIQVICLVAGIAYGVPQVVRVLRMRTAAGVSLLAWQLLGATTAAWTVHGFVEHSPAIVVSNGMGVLTSVLLIASMIRERRPRLLPTLALPLLLFAGLLAVRFGAGPVPFGLVIMAPQLLSSSGQLIELIRAEDVRGVSPVFLWIGVGLQALWLVYGLVLPDPAITISAASSGLLALLNLGWYMARRAGLRAHPGFGRRGLAADLDPGAPSATGDAAAANHPVG